MGYYKKEKGGNTADPKLLASVMTTTMGSGAEAEGKSGTSHPNARDSRGTLNTGRVSNGTPGCLHVPNCSHTHTHTHMHT